MDLDLAEILRRFENLIRIGTIAEIDESAALVRVKYDQDETGANVLTGWIRWGVSLAGGDITWNPPQLGEQVAFIAPSGDPSIGFVICSHYQDTYPAPDNSPNKRLIRFADGALFEYDKSAKTLTVTLPTGGKMDLTGGLNLSGDLAVAGNVSITGQLTLNGINVGTHTHIGNQGSPTGPMQ